MENADGTVGTSVNPASIGNGNTCRHFQFVAGQNPCTSCSLPGGTGHHCSADQNGNCEISLQDLAILLAAFGTHTGDPAFNPTSDLNHDGAIGLQDLAILLAQFGDICH